MKKITPTAMVIYLALSLWAATTILPFLWVINNSFKTTSQILTQSFALAASPTLENYTAIFNDPRIPIVQAYFNSILISGTVSLAVILLAALFAFGITRYRFKLSGFFGALIIAAQMFPVYTTIIPNFKMMSAVGLRNNIFSVVILQIAGNLAFASIVLISYMRSLPVDLEEAAFIEGCSVYQILFKIVFPITKPAFATVAIFSFLWSYNDLFTQIFLLRGKTGYTINRLLNQISSLDGGTNYGLMASSIVLIVAPVIVVYVLLQKNIIKGLTAGAVKG